MAKYITTTMGRTIKRVPADWDSKIEVKQRCPDSVPPMGCHG